jgi:hypothetical protein
MLGELSAPHAPAHLTPEHNDRRGDPQSRSGRSTKENISFRCWESNQQKKLLAIRTYKTLSDVRQYD